jgi:hypothetical protein
VTADVSRQTFTATLEDSGRGSGRWLVVPFDARDCPSCARRRAGRDAPQPELLSDRPRT